MTSIKKYYSLTKPGVLFGNVLTTVAGFLLASKGDVNFLLLIATFIGTTLVIASACVLNNYFDRDIDAVMERTKKRATANGMVKGLNAVIYSIVLGILGMLILYSYTNLLVVLIGLVGFIDYVFFYAMLSKRKLVHGTLIGSISGAMPILAGYCAVAGQIDIGAILVFLILFFWQMPEFYSISIYRRDEYKAAGVPVVSVVHGIENTRTQIFVYAVLFVISTILLSVFRITGYAYLGVMLGVGMYFLYLAGKGFRAKNLNYWARQLFHFALVILLIFCLMISLNGLLP